MNIKDAKNELLHTIQVYTRKDAHGRYLMPAVRQRPLLLIGPPGIGKTAIMEQVAKESYRVLKKQGICAFMIGDIRKKGYVLPLGMNSMQKFVDTGFKFKEIVIKEQHNCRSTDYWEGKERKFLMLAHEYIFILEKADDHNPNLNEKLNSSCGLSQ